MYNYHRRHTIEVNIGNTPLGGENPIRIQSMTNTSTLDTPSSVEQCIAIIDAGADYVRLTAQGVREADNLGNIRRELRERGYTTPLVADIHFNAHAADVAAENVEKVRINPGNFVDRVKTFEQHNYTDEEYAIELQRIRDRFVPFLNICKKHHTAIRIGVNHGSLSDRIMSRYGDTPQGMVESCLEFLRVCKDEDFSDVVISIKASNTVIMVETVRRLVDAMDKEEMHYPLHLGVTEAGDSEDGRIKSAVGIGTLLAQGIGDTIRVSLSEDPKNEVPVAGKLVNYITSRAGHAPIEGSCPESFSAVQPQHRPTHPCGIIGSNNTPIVIGTSAGKLQPDFLYNGNRMPHTSPLQRTIVDFIYYTPLDNVFPLLNASQVNEINHCTASTIFVQLDCTEATLDILQQVGSNKQAVIILTSHHINPIGDCQAVIHRMVNAGITTPVVIKMTYHEDEAEELQIKSGVDLGAIMIDHYAEGLWLENNGTIPSGHCTDYAFAILQAARLRTSKTEYISCPSCGRTLFDLQQTIARVKAATSHLKELKIGIMGCIVNGPGEMADADYGYVGCGPKRIALYKGKRCIERNIPEEEAVEHLVALIKSNGDWHEA
ncbi:MAG: 4-hydroxy-3-methylbut-2-en-1-yl diphosphate synthase [Bacteroidaceae bacterium]|nr:4-hydroxy-3-methylbut-2-en-1-yl diphosphate synthase [Bacteroidaceae bacterium]